jgi:Uma2 family endonuclease
MSVSQKNLTLEEFLKLPETEPASEYHGGRITQKPMPQGKHSVLQLRWIAWINGHVEPTRRGLAFPELRCTFAGRSLVPDVAFVAAARIPRDADDSVADVFRLAPDLAIEIISPDQPAADLREKLSFCVQNGVRLGVLVDPYGEELTLFKPDEPPEVVRSGTVDLGPVIPGLTTSVEQVFGWLR